MLLDTWANDKSSVRVELYSLEGWGHGWPRSRKVHATQMIWKFFEEHARPPLDQLQKKGTEKKGPGKKGPGKKGNQKRRAKV